MGRVLIIGAGGVGTVVAHKVAQNADVFTDIMIASRTKEKCDKIVDHFPPSMTAISSSVISCLPVFW